MNEAPPPASTGAPGPSLVFVAAVSRWEVFHAHLLQSPCLQQGRHPLVACWNVDSAAQAFDTAARAYPTAQWLVWVHQDVRLPPDWEQAFLNGIQQAEHVVPHLSVVGVYGIGGGRTPGPRAGHVLDRGRLLREAMPLPTPAHSLDELLFAVRGGCDLTLDARLGFDFYATDLVLQARRRGLGCAIIDAYCEHWSDTPHAPPLPHSLCTRIRASAAVFESKWEHALPVHTPLLPIHRPGDVGAFIDHLQHTGGAA